MNTTLLQCFGIDIAKQNFTVTLCSKQQDHTLSYSSSVTFDNNKKGFNQFMRWVRKQQGKDCSRVYVMEATGIYYETLAYHLFKLKKQVCVVLPNKVKYFAKSLNIKSKTDPIDSKLIAQMGVERKMPLWQPPAPIFKELRELTRLYSDLKQEQTVFINRKKSIECGESPNRYTIKTLDKLIKQLQKQASECKQKIRELIKSDKELSIKFSNLLTIKGIGPISLAIIIAETQGFAMINNRKQLASYVGYDIVQKESGTSVKGKTRISKKGNSRVRAALHFPALVALRYNKAMKVNYNRIINRKQNKMIGVVAIQRKMLLLVYSLWKSNSPFIEDYETKKKQATSLEAAYTG